MNKGDYIKLAEIISNYSNPEKQKRDQSEKKLKDLRKKNMGLLSLGLLELSFSEISNITLSSNEILTCLVLLRKIIEIDGKKYWGNISQSIKEKIKNIVINIIVDYSNTKSHIFINNIILIIEQLVLLIEDFNESWPELIKLTNQLLKLTIPNDINTIIAITKTIKYCLSFLSNEILIHISYFDNFYKNIFECDLTVDKKMMELKVVTCSFYSELISYSLNNSICDISDSYDFFSYNIIKTLQLCIENMNNEIYDTENLIKELFNSIDVFPEILSNDSDIFL